MVKIVGKFLLILFLITIFFSSYCTSIKLEAYGVEGEDLEQVAAGQPFVLDVSIQDSTATPKPKIDGIQEFHVGHTSFQIRTVNGRSSVKYVTQIRIDKPGVYTLGPAEVTIDGNIYRSRSLEITVGDKQIVSNGDVRKDKEKFFLQLVSDKKNVVVGEKINCVLRFYFTDDSTIKFPSFSAPDVKELRRKDKKDSFRSREKVGKEIYNYIELRWSVFPKTVGEITLPAHRADFQLRVEDPHWSGFRSLFGLDYENKHVFSNALTFSVSPLPQYDGTVHAVGEFIDFSGSVDRAVAKQGDGIVYTLQVEGSGDLENLEIKQLQNMPACVKYYDSKSYIRNNSAKPGMRKKRFEFIVQGMEEGECTIPAQTFTFFDTKTKKYKTLKTSPVVLKILPSLGNKMPLPGITPRDEQEDAIQESKIADIRQYGVWYGMTERKLPFWLFVFLIFLPLVPFGFVEAKKISYNISHRYSPHMIKKYAFAKAIKDLKHAKRKNNFSVIYSIFITFFAQKFELKESIITQDTIIHILKEKGFLLQEINSWEHFIARISSFVFYERDKVATFDKEFFDQAIKWIEIFETKMRS